MSPLFVQRWLASTWQSQFRRQLRARPASSHSPVVAIHTDSQQFLHNLAHCQCTGTLRTSVFWGKIVGVPTYLIRPADWNACNIFRGGRIYGGSYDEKEAYLYLCRYGAVRTSLSSTGRAVWASCAQMLLCLCRCKPLLFTAKCSRCCRQSCTLNSLDQAVCCVPS